MWFYWLILLFWKYITCKFSTILLEIVIFLLSCEITSHLLKLLFFFYIVEPYPTCYPYEPQSEGCIAANRPSNANLYPSSNVGFKQQQQPNLTTNSSSATCSSENSSPPACLRWAQSLHMLLQDPDGVKLFQRYLNCEGKHHADVLDFWFACEGLRKEVVGEKIHLLVKVIYKWVNTFGDNVQAGVPRDNQQMYIIITKQLFYS